MGDLHLACAVVRPWPEWLRIRDAVDYSGMSRRRLLALLRSGEIQGYQDQSDRRGPRGAGTWWIRRVSIDHYHERQAGLDAIEAAAARLRAS